MCRYTQIGPFFTTYVQLQRVFANLLHGGEEEAIEIDLGHLLQKAHSLLERRKPYEEIKKQ